MSGQQGSPSLLIRRSPSVRRLNRLPLLAAYCIGVTVVGVAGYAVYQRFASNAPVKAEEATAEKTQGSKTPAFLKMAATGSQPDTPKTESPPKKQEPSPSPQTNQQQPMKSGEPSVDEQARAQAWQAYYAQRAQLISAHNAMEQQARSGPIDPFGSGSGSSGSQLPNGPADAPGDPNDKGGYSVGGVNPPGQTGKQAFLKTPGDPFGVEEDTPGSVHGPKPSTVMEGTGLPCRLVEGATSDMPGQLNAEISTNVYDSMTGDILLIPQGTKVVTKYDIAVSAGQDRMGVISQRLIFPDTSSRQIGSMPVADQAGLAGLSDLTDHHFWEKFGAALTISLIGAGAQLAQPQQSAFATPSSTSAATGAMTQQLSQFGMAQAQNGMSIPNTIRLRPGLACLVKLNKDLRLPEYRDARLVTSPHSGSSTLTVGRFLQ